MSGSPILVDVETAAAFACVEPDTIHQWASRGRVLANGTRHRLIRYGTPRARRFDLREITWLLSDTPTSTGAR